MMKIHFIPIVFSEDDNSNIRANYFLYQFLLFRHTVQDYPKFLTNYYLNINAFKIYYMFFTLKILK